MFSHPCLLLYLSVCPFVFLSASLAPTGPSWVLCEHSDFRGRQWLVSSCEITNWLTYSGTQRVGSLYPIKQVGRVSAGGVSHVSRTQYLCIFVTVLPCRHSS